MPMSHSGPSQTPPLFYLPAPLLTKEGNLWGPTPVLSKEGIPLGPTPAVLPRTHTKAGRALFSIRGSSPPGLPFAAFAPLLKRHQFSRLSSFIFLAPIFGVLLGHLLLQEPLTAYLGVGLGLVAVGIFIVNRPRRRLRLTVRG